MKIALAFMALAMLVAVNAELDENAPDIRAIEGGKYMLVEVIKIYISGKKVSFICIF